MRNFLDESFHIYALKKLRVGTKVKLPRLAIIFAWLVFCEVAQRSSSGNAQCADLIYVFSPCMMLMQWTGQKLHRARLATMLACTGNANQCDIFLFYFSRLRWLCKCTRTRVMAAPAVEQPVPSTPMQLLFLHQKLVLVFALELVFT